MDKRVASCELPVASKGAGHSAGFTLVEMLTVLAIIVLILATAVPVFNTLTGNHSLAAAQNRVAAELATARADAIYTRQVTGIFFYIDPATDAVAMAEVQADPQLGGGTTYTPLRTDMPNGTVNDAAPNNGPVNALEMVNYWDTTLATPQFVYYRDVVVLPANIGIALYNNYLPYGYPTGANALPQLDRYVRVGAILFDANGMVTSLPYAVPQTRGTPYGNYVNKLGIQLGLRGKTDPQNRGRTGDLASDIEPIVTSSTQLFFPLVSQVGLLFYDRSAFLNQRTTNTSMTHPDQAFTDADLQYLLPNQSWVSNDAVNTDWPLQKTDEETWLDQNGVAVLVSPFNGSLIAAK